MNSILKKFVDEPLFDACAAMLHHLHISFNEVTRTPVSFEALYRSPLTKALQEILVKVENTYFIGTVDEASLSGRAARQDENDVTAKASEGKYVGMMIFAVDIKPDQTLIRTELATLTRGFNRIAAAQPVVLFIKQGDRLALATCERSNYTQQWRDGEKLGKVSLLRDINCLQPHRGHIDILESIGDKPYPTYEELYKHWMQVFSSELLTKKFYSELSDWYAWAVQVARFPNDLATTEDDEKFNHESCIRLITRLIFVWFLKQKHLIPEEFFDENYIREHFIENFDPHDRQSLYYNAEESKYYRLILQNLFFAMLNRPIVPEGKDTPNNRRFRVKGNYRGMNPDYAVNNLLRYEGDFKDGGAAEFLTMANSNVPFLNGGLFDCLDDKPKNLYYDGFSERRESLDQLYLPDWLFFGEEVGKGIDLSQWYDDAKKRNVSARGIIDILKRYNFTIEENTPLDQEVSLDPELLGKAFENLLASYNPETKTSARKQTGSFYTPREIVQYMVDESLVAHLKRICGDELEPQYRSLLSYATEETALNEEQRRSIMQAIYNCRVLDPACGSGAFPMGVLQQMVHVLRQLDPTNEMWRKYMEEKATEESRNAFAENSADDLKERLADIGESFNKSINDPDYARKLYLIEHCIYGVDIQPIAVQISKLRFFISLVVDQNPTDDAAHNFGIRPLPNLESKFVAANTLIPVEYDASLFESTEAILSLKESLKELNHAIFLAKRNIDKQRIKTKIKETRKALANAIEDTGFVNPGAAQKLADWDMFEQNTHADFFDAEWMFGVKGGFDIVIGNPPYKIVSRDDECKAIYDSIFEVAHGGKRNLYHLFFERGILALCTKGTLSYITPDTYFSGNDTAALRLYFINNTDIDSIVHYTERDRVFENVTQAVAVIVLRKCHHGESFTIIDAGNTIPINYANLNKDNKYVFKSSDAVIERMKKSSKVFEDICDGYKGDVNLALKRDFFCFEDSSKTLPLIRGVQLGKYSYSPGNEFCYKAALSKDHTGKERIVFQEIANMGLLHRVKGTILRNVICGDSCNLLFSKNSQYDNKFVLAILNSKAVNYYFKFYNQTNHVPIGEVRKIPFPDSTLVQRNRLISIVDEIFSIRRTSLNTDTLLQEQEIDRIVYHLYGLTYDEVLIIDPTPPFTQEEYEQE